MDAVLRLARLLDQPKDIPVLAPLFTKRFFIGCYKGKMGLHWSIL